MTNNPALYDSVLCAVAACNQGWLATPVLNQTPSAVAIATEVDSKIPTILGGATISQRSLVESIAKSVFSGRNPLSTDPNAYAPLSTAIAEAFNQYSPLLTTGLANQGDWYIDGLNGNDGNSGKLGFPLKTQQEWARRNCPNQSRLLMTSDVNVFIAPGSAPFLEMYFGAGTADDGVYTLRIICQIASTANMPITAVTQANSSTSTRCEITTSSGTFVAGSRIRLTSGTSVGAIAYSTGLVGANPLHTYSCGFVLPHYEGFHNYYFPTIGDTCVVDTLSVLVRRIELDCGPNARIEVRDMQIIRAVVNGCAEGTPSGDQGGNVIFSGCEPFSVAGNWTTNSGGACAFGCRWIPTTKTALRGFGWLVWGGVVQGLMGVANGDVASYGICIDGGQLVINIEDNFEYKGHQGYSRFNANQSYNATGTIEIENGGNAYGVGAAINILTAGEFYNCGRGPTQSEIWGNSAPYAKKYNIQPGGFIYQILALGDANQFLNLGLFPGTVAVTMAGVDYAITAAPIIDTNHNCGVIAGS